MVIFRLTERMAISMDSVSERKIFMDSVWKGQRTSMDAEKITTSIDDLPEDIVEYILQRLAIKTLGVCLCVKKQWLSLIKSPRFIGAKDMIKSEDNRFSILWNVDSENFEMYTDRSDKYEFHSHLNLPDRQCKSAIGYGIGCCRGLMCVEKLDGNIILWNPIIRKMLTLPKPYCYNNNNINDDVSSVSPAVQCLGLGFDPLTSDYKVVMILQFDHHSVVELFSLKSYSWKILSQKAPAYVIHDVGLACLDGYIHWNNYDGKLFILEFNVSTEQFKEIDLPQGFKGVVIGGPSAYQQSSIAIWSSPPGSYHLWVMKEYGCVESWSNILSFDFTVPKGFFYSTMLGLRYQHEMLLTLSGDSDKVTISIDPKSGEVKYVQLSNNDGINFQENFIRYFEETLTLIDDHRAATYINL